MLNPLPPASACVELSPSRAAVAEALRLPPGQPVITVTLRFDDTAGAPVGLTIVTLKPELFRVAIDAVFSGGIQTSPPRTGSLLRSPRRNVKEL